MTNYPSCMGSCHGARLTCKHKERCTTTTLMPPALAWLVRELRARSQLWRWYCTERKEGHTRRRAAWLAWRITNPINTYPRKP